MSKKHQNTAREETGSANEDIPFGAVEDASGPAVSEVAPRRTRTKVDVTKLDPLDAKLYRMRQAHRVIKIARELDADSLALAIDELGKLQTQPTE